MFNYDNSTSPQYWIVTINVQILRIWEQQEKNGEKTAREASKRRKSDSLTEDGKLYRCRSFNSIFYLQNSYFNFFLKNKISGQKMWEWLRKFA